MNHLKTAFLFMFIAGFGVNVHAEESLYRFHEDFRPTVVELGPLGIQVGYSKRIVKVQSTSPDGPAPLPFGLGKKLDGPFRVPQTEFFTPGRKRGEAPLDSPACKEMDRPARGIKGETG